VHSPIGNRCALRSNDIRKLFKEFLDNDERFLKFTDSVQEVKGRLYFWQEGIWEDFTNQYPNVSRDFADIVTIFRYCQLHDVELLSEKTKVFHGNMDYCSRQLAIEAKKFPCHGRRTISSEGGSMPDYVTRWYCPICRSNYDSWCKNRLR